ncbi:MAG: Bifunctional synthase/transferase [Candidatus Pacebacteria bacterium GW2011_GWA1_46_10]|nr:MAG: Bifunctional synthase/transferase [Candidatus Pacebacteria bacterium GW2011_GWA1_46_10]HCR81280.1 D-glycero-beta-D-manno-heptose 1-phosphate adenylyltransferase [Candidatus Paceibacterota bacterium]
MIDAANGHKVATSYQAVKQFIKNARRLKKKIVLTQGSFDMLHIGHARYCREAKKHGDTLIVGVDSDEKIRARKGEGRPIVPQAERLEMLTHLEYVDLVVLKELNTPKWELIKIVRPDVLIATAQTYTQPQIEELEQICGQVVVLQPMATTSTSAKLRLMQIEAAQKIQQTLTSKLISTIEETLRELKGEKKPAR